MTQKLDEELLARALRDVKFRHELLELLVRFFVLLDSVDSVADADADPVSPAGKARQVVRELRARGRAP